MIINKLTSNANSAVSKAHETILSQAKTATKKLLNESELISARFNLELNAENLSPQEYIRARNYLSNLEFSEYAKNEMIKL